MNILDRIVEPSTMAGMAAISQVIAAVSPTWAAVFHGFTVAFGALAVAMREKGKAA